MLDLDLEVREDLDKVDKEQEFQVMERWGQEHSRSGEEWIGVNGNCD